MNQRAGDSSFASQAGSFRHTAQSHVPALVQRRIAQDSQPIRAPREEALRCAVLFADITGFTALAERLARGVAGLERLTRELNAFFGELLLVIAEHGGDVVKFAGDALLALWHAEGDDRLAEPTLRAAQCALAVQERLRARRGRGERLTLRLALSAGELAGVHVGGVLGRWELLLTGEPLRAVGRAASLCRPGDVVLAPEAWRALGGHGDGCPLEEGVVRLDALRTWLTPAALVLPELGSKSQEAIWAYLPGAIRARMQAGQNVWLAELRRITVLFANLPGREASLSLARWQELMTATQSIVYRYEGSINKLSIDDKGLSLVAALGLPPLAHEDDAARGLKAALDLSARLARFGWQSAIGVATGRAFCGLVGSTERCEYTMIGDVVNLAARLMQAALGGILCDEETERGARGEVELERLAPLRLKGKAEPVVVFRPLGYGSARRRLRPWSELVGRERERAALAERIEALGRGESSVVLLEGEAGIGKSRLMVEAHSLAPAEALVLLGAADAVERTTPYQAWRGVLFGALALDELDDAQARRERVHGVLSFDPELARLAPLLDDVLHLDLLDNEHTSRMSGEVRVAHRHQLVLGILGRLAAQAPLLITLEDAHWMDSASWALVGRVQHEVAPLLLLLTTRPPATAPSAEYRALLDEPGTLRIALDALDLAQTRAIVRQRLRVKSLPDGIEEGIHARAQGNPFFTEELAYSLRDSGFLCFEGERCWLAAGVDARAAPEFPDTVQGVVTQRVDRLAPNQQLALKVASVIGRVFSFETLRDVFPVEAGREGLEADVERLRELDLTRQKSPAPNLAFVFKHIITQEVTYNLMLFAQRRKLHRDVALWYEEHHADDLSPFFALLAHHWQAAGEDGRAIDCYAKAADQARRSHANEEAIVFYGEALRLDAERDTGDLALRAHWEQELGEAHYALAQRQQARAHLQRATELLGRPFAPPGWRLSVAFVRELALQALHRALPGLTRARVRAGDARLLAAVRASERIGQLHYLDNETLPATYAVLRALNLAEAMGVSPELARCYANLSVVASFVSLTRLAVLYVSLAHETAARVGDGACRAYVLEVTGIYCTGIGQWARARELLGEALALALELGDQRRWEECQYTLVLAVHREGDFDACIRESERMHAAALRRRLPQVRIWGLAGRLAGELTRGAGRETAATLAELLAAHSAALAGGDRIYAYGWLALARWRFGREADALAAAEVVAELASHSGSTSHNLAEGFGAAAEVYLGLWERDGHLAPAPRAHLSTLDKALRRCARFYRIARPYARLHEGTLLWLAGARARALQRWRAGAESARALAMPYLEARALEWLGRHSGEAGAGAQLERALELFRGLGASADLERVAARARTHEG